MSEAFESYEKIDAKDDPRFEAFWASSLFSRHALDAQITMRIMDIRRELKLAWREALRKDAAALDKDAARYRWLRDQQRPYGDRPFIGMRCPEGISMFVGDLADATVDAAMGEK